jgi:uncharacterized protein YndB with AHSA1/START domain
VAEQTPLHFVFYFAAPPDKVWEGFVSPESNRIIFMGADLEVDLKPGGPMNWVGTGPTASALPTFVARCSGLSRQSFCNTHSLLPLRARPPVSR